MNKHKSIRITLANVRAARNAFEKNEPRDLFYRAATVLVGLARRDSRKLTVAEALAVLLQTWNRAYYQYRDFDKRHFAKLDALLTKYRDILARCHEMTIEELTAKKKATLTALFEAFEEVLGPVGAAKTLHLLAPMLFPLWDRSIAKAYGLPLGLAGSNGDRYWQFMLRAQNQCRYLGRYKGNRLKAIDEYNYCKYTKGWF